MCAFMRLVLLYPWHCCHLSFSISQIAEGKTLSQNWLSLYCRATSHVFVGTDWVCDKHCLDLSKNVFTDLVAILMWATRLIFISEIIFDWVVRNVFSVFSSFPVNDVNGLNNKNSSQYFQKFQVENHLIVGVVTRSHITSQYFSSR